MAQTEQDQTEADQLVTSGDESAARIHSVKGPSAGLMREALAFYQRLANSGALGPMLQAEIEWAAAGDVVIESPQERDDEAAVADEAMAALLAEIDRALAAIAGHGDRTDTLLAEIEAVRAETLD